MRRAALLALLAAPALVLAQAPAPGKLTILPDSTVGQSECSAGSGATLDSVMWTIQPEGTTTFVPGSAFRIIASNTAPPTTASGSTKANFCYEPGTTTSGTTTGIKSGFLRVSVQGSLTEDIPATAATQQVIDVSIPDIMKAAGLDACSGTTNVTVTLCVHNYPRQGSTLPPAYDPTPVGYASGTLTLSFSKPPRPRNVTARPGDRRLMVSFAAGEVTSGLVASSQFAATATPVCTIPPPAPPAPQTCDPNAVRSSSRVSSSPAVVTGLVNYQLYDVTVKAYSAAGNAGDPSTPAVAGTPLPVNDFFDQYVVDGGTEQGGCASGPAGALALLGTASLLALRRRSK